MRLRIAWVGKTKEPAIRALTEEYLKRLSRYAPTERLELTSEAALLKQQEKLGPSARLILLDARGKHLTSEQIAEFIREQQGRGTQMLVFAIGPADGFSDEARKKADVLLSLSRMTLAHEVARIVLLEQLYRAFTILQGHPYHRGH